MSVEFCVLFFFQAEDGIRDLVRSRGLGDVYKRQGAVRDGRVYMPPFEGTLSQEAMWSIRAWLETVHEE